MKQESNWNDEHFGVPDWSVKESLTLNKYMLSSRFNAPLLKQVECGFWKDVSYYCNNYILVIVSTFYFFIIAKNFGEFCRSHPLLERIRLNQIYYFYGSFYQSDEPFAAHNWNKKQLPNIKALSLHPNILHTSHIRSNGHSFGKLISEITSLEELEIGPDLQEMGFANPFLKRYVYF